jgi:hypothetical protein
MHQIRHHRHRDGGSEEWKLLTLWAYAGYVGRPGRGRYMLALFLFCLGLMAKPMLVSLPVVPLLLNRQISTLTLLPERNLKSNTGYYKV